MLEKGHFLLILLCSGALTLAVILVIRSRARSPKQPPREPVPDQLPTPLDHSPTQEPCHEKTGPGWSTGTGDSATERHLDVSLLFPGRDATTIAWAQKFVDAALHHNGVTAQKHEEGVKFSPNFVLIERIYTRDRGFVVSFYGAPYRFASMGIKPRPGRGPSYSRISVRSSKDLEIALRAMGIAHSLKPSSRFASGT